jgi:ABC-type methionine transport system permease subunit
MNRHPGIRIHSISAEGWPGLIFTVAVLVIFLIGIPAMRWFLLAGIAGGLAVAGILRFFRR